MTALVNAARSGDADARAALLGEYLPLLYNIVGRGLHGHADVDDVVQETMLRAMRALPELRDPERFRSWIVAIAIRQMHDHRRRNKAALARHTQVADAAEVPDPVGDFAELAVDRQTLSRAGSDLLEASRWLSDEQRRTLALWWQETAGQLTRAEVAEALHLSVPHTAVRIQRMKAKLEVAVGVLAAWRARPRCAELDTLAGGRRGVPEGRLLVRLERHVAQCPQCGAAVAWRSIDDLPIRIGALAIPAALVAAIPGLVTQHAVTPGLVSSLLNTLHHGLARVSAKSAAVVVGTTATLAVVIGVTVHQLPSRAHGTDPAQGLVPTAGAPHQPGRASSGTTPSATPTTAFPSYSGVTTADYYVAPTGDDTNPGTLARPFATLTRAVAKARPGQTVALRGGTYHPATTITLTSSGTTGHRITVSNYRDERPVFDGSGIPAGGTLIAQSGEHVTVQGIEILDSPGNPYVCTSCHDDVLARLSVHGNARTGLVLHGAGTHDNLILDSDFYDNHETGTTGGYVDGLALNDGSGSGNRVRGCRIYDNSGDGMDLTGFGDTVTVEHSWAFGNGVNRWGIATFSGGGSGFKLGGDAGLRVAHVVTNSAAWDNAGFGFTETGSSGTPRLTNDTAYRNGAAGFAFVHSAAILQRNLSLANHPDHWLGSQAGHTGNSWDQSGWTTAALLTADAESATAPRRHDGQPPGTSFLSNSKDPSIGATLTS
ncbi:sigma-70 family RNA polymerase sigma factor [Streptomyces sp. NPDC001833]|uniref:sigma-70 family RNA polymerase sigma factor n=1 Tax=Streptomyces sp. NPDC001833 TaxID=3154658 RepID=UPI00332AF106